jgi:hypothetical protein
VKKIIGHFDVSVMKQWYAALLMWSVIFKPTTIFAPYQVREDMKNQLYKTAFAQM